MEVKSLDTIPYNPFIIIYNRYFYELNTQMNSVKNPVLCCFLLEFPYEPVRIQLFDVAHIVP